MSENTAEQAREMVDAVYRAESRRVFATLVRVLGDFDLAEEALHDAFAAAVEQWPREGVPANPRAWLVSAGRFKAIDAMRRRARFDASLGELAERLDSRRVTPRRRSDDERVEDDRLRLIFTCCHPALAAGGPGGAHAPRSVRADDRRDRQRVSHGAADARPADRAGQDRRFATREFRSRCRRADDLPERLETVLQVIYLVFNEGYCGVVGRVADAARSVGRGDSAGAAAGRAVARAGGRWACWR